MSEIKRIEDQLRRSFEGEAWPGPSVWEALENVTAPQATAKPLAHAHSIWEIVNHLTVWQREVIRRLEGIGRILTDEEDWPPVDNTTDEAWQSTLTALKQSYAELSRALSQISESRLDEPILPEYSSVYVTIHGLVQHNLYHAGQIALLKKA